MSAASLALTTHRRALLSTSFLLAAVAVFLLPAAPAGADEEPVVLIEDTFTNTPIRPVDGYLDRTPAEYGAVVWEADPTILMGRDEVTNLANPGVQTATVRIDNQGYPFAELTVEAEVDPTDTEHVGLGFTKVRKGRFDTKGQVWISLTPAGDVRVYADGTAILLYQALGHPAFRSGANTLTLQYHLTTETVRAWLNDDELPIPQPQLSAFGFDPDPKYVGFFSTGTGGKAVRYGSIDSLIVSGSSGPMIVQHPLDWTAVEGTLADFWVLVHGGVGEYTYQWRSMVDGTSGFSNVNDGGVVSGSKAQTLTIGEVGATAHQGLYKVMVKASSQQELPPGWLPPSDEARLDVIPAVVAEHFKNQGRGRSPGSHLNGVEAEVGDRDWVATSGLGFGTGCATNTSSASPLIGNVPFAFSEAATPDYQYATVEAWVHAPPEGLTECLDGWAGVGFSSSASGSYATDGQVWAYLKGSRLHVRANGVAHSLLTSTEAHPEYQDEWNYLKIRYDRVFNRVEVWLNQVPIELTVDDLDTFSFTPTISHAGFHGNCGGPYQVPDGFILDDFAAAYDGLIGPLAVVVTPPEATVQRNYVATFTAQVNGGLEPYAYQWQRWDTGTVDWVNMANDARVSGATSATLSISGVSPSDDQSEYHVKVTDSSLPMQQVISPPVELLVANATYECTPAVPSLADFSIDQGGWTGYGMTLQEYVESASFVIGENGSYIASDVPVPVPAGYTRVELTMRNTSPDPISGYFWWGNTSADRVHFDLEVTEALQTIERDLKDTSFAEVASSTGITHRNLKISFTTPHLHGIIYSIDAFPGGRVEFEGDPRLFIGNLEAESYAAGATMTLRQTVKNNGCDMGFGDNPEERDVTFTLCREGSPGNCSDAFEQCNAGYDTKKVRGHVTAWGALDQNDTMDLSPCTIQLPPAQPQNIGRWVLRGTFDDDPTKNPTELRFDLVERGIPNLAVEPFITFEAYQDTGSGVLERSSFLDARFPFDLYFGGDSYFYPASDVPVKVWVRPHDPGEELGEDGWVMVANRRLSSLGDGGEPIVTGISVAALLPYHGEYWTLLDVRVALDPDDEIDELGYEGDNEYTVYDFIPVAIADGDLGKAIGQELGKVYEFDQESTDFTTFNLWSAVNQGEDVLATQYGYLDPGAMRQPVLFWTSPTTNGENEGITGVMVRYKRQGNAHPAYLNAGASGAAVTSTEAYSVAKAGEAATMTAEAAIPANELSVDLVGNNQWHTVVLKTLTAPFSDYNAKSVAGDPPGPFLSLALDSSSVYGNYPYVSFDFIRVWAGGTAQAEPVDAEPYALVYQGQGGTWLPLTAAGPHTVLRLGVHVGVTGDLTLTHDNIEATMEVDVGNASQSPPLTTLPSAGTFPVNGRDGEVFPFTVQDQSTWEVPEGFSGAEVEVALDGVSGEGLIAQANNHKVFFVANIQKTNGAGDGALPQEAKGYQSSGYDLSRIENVNLANGNLTLSVPLCSLATDAGLSYDLTLVYNSKLWSYQSWLDPDPDAPRPAYIPPDQLGVFEARGVMNYGVGWDLRPPHVTIDHQRRIDSSKTDMLKVHSWVDASGASHELYSSSLAEAGTCIDSGCHLPCDFSATNACYTWDGSNLRATPVCVWADPGQSPGVECVAVDGVDIEDGNGVVYRHRLKAVPGPRTDKATMDFADDVPGFYLTSLESGPWQGGQATNQIRFNYELDIEQGAAYPHSVRLTAVEVVDFQGTTVRQVTLGYEPMSASYGMSAGSRLIQVLTGVSYPSSAGTATVALSYSGAVVQRPGDKVLASLFYTMPFLEEVTHQENGETIQKYDILYDNIAGGVDKGLLSGMTIPSGAEVSYEFGNYPVWRRRCDMSQYNAECQPGGAGETWCSGDDFPTDSASDLTTGVRTRTVRYEDAETAGDASSRLESTRFRQHVSCGACPYPDEGCVDSYTGGVPQPDDDYLWTWVETFSGEQPTGVRTAEIHRFHPGSYREQSVDLLEPFEADLGGADPGSTLGLEASEPLAGNSGEWLTVRVAQHTRRTWEMAYPGLQVNPVRSEDPSAFVTAERVLTDGGGTLGGSDVRDCHLGGTCDELLTSTPEVNAFLQPEHVTITGGDTQDGTRVERYTETTYDTFDEESGYGVHWYVPRPVESRVRPTADFDCETRGGQVVVCQTTTWDWDTVPTVQSSYPPTELGFPRPLRMVRQTVNPTGAELDQCSADCQATTYGYVDDGQHAGNLESEWVRGGFGLGALTKSVFTVYEYEHGRASHKYLSSTGPGAAPEERLDLWTRGINEDTQQVTWHLDGSGNGFEYRYDALGRLTEFAPMTDSGGSLPTHQLVPASGAALHGTGISYMQPSSGGLFENVVRDIVYSGANTPLGTGTPSTIRARYVFDGLGRTTRVTETYPGVAASERSTFTIRDFSEDGRRELTSTWVNGTDFPPIQNGEGWTEVVVDGLGRPVSVTQPDVKTITTVYAGNRVSAVTRQVATAAGDETDVVTRTVTDPLGRVRALTEDADGLEYELGYTYDVADRLTRVMDEPNSSNPVEVASFQYSAGGYLLEARDRDRVTSFAAYDDLGNATSETTGKASGTGTQTDLAFDEYGRLATKTVHPESGSPYVALAMTYGTSESAYGKPLTALQRNRYERDMGSTEDVDVLQSWAYGGPGGTVSGRTTTVTAASGSSFTVSYGRDRWGNLKTVTQPGGAATMSTWDGPWLTGGSRSTLNALTTFAYHPSGRVARQGLGAELTLLEDVDPHGMARPDGYRLKHGTEPAWTDLWIESGYDFDPSGNLTAIGAPGLTFEYDALSRLTRREKAGQTDDTYTPDRWGNITSMTTAVGGTVSLPPETNSNRLAGRTYDARGNLRDPAPGVTVAFSAEDRLMTAAVTGPPAKTWSYAYDAAGERVAAWAGDSSPWTFYARDEAGQVAAELTGYPGQSQPLSLSRTYLLAGGRLFAQKDATGELRYVVQDHLGSTRRLISEDGLSSEAYSFDAFGQLESGATTPATKHLYTGHERDTGEDQTGLDYMHARYYTAGGGRFLSVDPVGGEVGNSQSWNRYSYVQNNPLKYTDPTGKALDTILDIGFVAYDLYVIGKDNIGGGTTQGLGMNLAALGGDVVGAMVPFLTGGGAAVRGGMKLAGGVDDVVDGARAVENVTDAARGVDGLADGARRLPFSDSERLTEVNRTLDRVEAGGPFPHKQDGSVFMNRKGRLPEGNYREYTVDTPGANNRGTRRVVVDGDSGRTYYSDDHYQNFVEIDPTRH